MQTALPFLKAPTGKDLELHRKLIAICRGTACFEEVARLYGTRSSNQLEIKIDRRQPKRDADGKKRWSGKYRKWRAGTGPDDETVKRVEDDKGKKARLRYWRDLLLWVLAAEPFQLSIPELHAAMGRLELPVRRIIFQADRPDCFGRYSREHLDREEILKLRNLGTLDSFNGMLGLAREGELKRDDQQHGFTSLCALEMFPRVVTQHPHLLQKWESLYRCLELPFWTRIYAGQFHLGASADKIRSEIESRAKRDCCTQLQDDPEPGRSDRRWSLGRRESK